MTPQPSQSERVRRDVWGLSRRQMGVLALLESEGSGRVTTGSSGLYDGELFVHWRTAESLDRRGLARLHDYGTANATVTL